MKKTTWILGWRSNSRHELSFSWRFCGPRLLFGGDISSATCIESSISRQDDAHKREPRKSTNYTGTVNTSSSLTLHLLSSFLLDLQLRKSSLLNYCISRCSVTTNLPLFWLFHLLSIQVRGSQPLDPSKSEFISPFDRSNVSTHFIELVYYWVNELQCFVNLWLDRMGFLSRFTGFTTNAYGSMEVLQCGKRVQKCLTTFPSQLWLMERSYPLLIIICANRHCRCCSVRLLTGFLCTWGSFTVYSNFGPNPSDRS